jgi:hypothetical protein
MRVIRSILRGLLYTFPFPLAIAGGWALVNYAPQAVPYVLGAGVTVFFLGIAYIVGEVM